MYLTVQRSNFCPIKKMEYLTLLNFLDSTFVSLTSVARGTEDAYPLKAAKLIRT